LSDVPLNKIGIIKLDYQSKTSVNLVKILAKHFWKITPKWENTTKGFEDKIAGATAGVIIGDRTFNLNRRYPFKYDLAEEWQKFTGLPFVFACWVANKKLPKTFIDNFNDALKIGVENIDKVVENCDKKEISKEKIRQYLTKNIDFNLDDKKIEAMHKFHYYLY